MSFSPSPMLLVGTLVAAAVVGAITPANAKTAPISDEAYVTAARCAGLVQGLGRDATPLKALIRAESGPRDTYVFNTAEEMRAEAVIEAKRAGEDGRRKLIAETQSACPALTEGGSQVASR